MVRFLLSVDGHSMRARFRADIELDLPGRDIRTDAMALGGLLQAMRAEP
jgi:hypothetical protein